MDLAALHQPGQNGSEALQGQTFPLAASTSMAQNSFVIFVETKAFTARIGDLLEDDEYREYP
jgi:hypothetical protein